MTSNDNTVKQTSTMCDVFSKRKGHTLRWENLTVEKGGKIIDDHVSGKSEAGHLTAVMGHSGSGKVSCDMTEQ